MRPRAGFTLLEVIVAITVTGVALTTAGMALSAARNTAARIASHGQRTEADSRVRTLLTDMLRHAPLAERVDEPLLAIDRRGPAPVLRFLTTGVREPYGTGGVWAVEVTVRDTELVVTAAPTARGATATPMIATLAGVSAFDVRVLEHGSALESARWRADWPLAQDLPRVIELEWVTDATGPSAPLRVLLAPLARPRS